MRLKILIAFLLTAIFGGCTAFQGKAYRSETSEVKKAYSTIELPQSITIDRETFTQKYKNLVAAYYYLSDEEEYKWSKLVSISYYGDVKSIDGYIYGIYETIAKSNEVRKKDEWRSLYIIKTSPTQAVIAILNPPAPGDPNFNKSDFQKDE